MLPIEDTEARRAALAYVIELYDELTEENGAPTLGTQNQAVAFILADPQRRQAALDWAAGAALDPPTTLPPRRLPQDALYQSVRDFLARIIERPVFARPDAQRP